METPLLLIIAVLIAAVIALAVKVFLMQKSAREITRQLTEHLAEETNTLIVVSGRDREMLRLAREINAQLSLLRDDRQRFLHGDAELKNAVTNISHDLRTPLTAICGYLDLIEHEDKSEELERYIAQIRNRTEALRELTEELLKYSVVTSVQELTMQPMSLNRALEESLVSFYGAMQAKSITPVVSIPDGRVERALDAVAVNRVFGNIIGNAVKYSSGDFEVSMDSNGKTVFINTAPGLDAVTAGRLFDRFYTVETGRSSTGLGLSIAKALTEKMGGEIRADYRDGRLIITVDFPESHQKEV